MHWLEEKALQVFIKEFKDIAKSLKDINKTLKNIETTLAKKR